MKIAILPSAIEDLAEGERFYELQQSGLGDYFMDSLFSDIESLKLYGGIHRKIFGFHRALSKRFPYCIYYGVDAKTVIVRAILDCRRNPEWIKRRLTER
jgi:hypothetical protein